MHLHWNIYIVLTLGIVLAPLTVPFQAISIRITLFLFAICSVSVGIQHTNREREGDEHKLHTIFIRTYYAFDIIKFSLIVVFLSFHNIHLFLLFTMRIALVLHSVYFECLRCYFDCSGTKERKIWHRMLVMNSQLHFLEEDEEKKMPRRSKSYTSRCIVTTQFHLILWHSKYALAFIDSMV